MEPLTFLLFVIIITWLAIHSSRASRRIENLEKTVDRLEKDAANAAAPTPMQPEQPVAPEPKPFPPEKEPVSAPREKAPEIDETSHSPTPPPLPARVANSPVSEHKPEPVLETPSPRPNPNPPPPPQPVAAAKAPSPPERPGFEWRPLLEKIKLWPPTGENAEAAIAGWWLSRIGLILLIIGAVFFGVRIAENTPPWLRLLTLAGISAGVTILGAWLERKLKSFGRLISAGGLGLSYFTAFAAYGVPATKIIENPVTGFFVQVIAVLIVIGWSIAKKDEAIAAMAILLGYVACWFSHAHDLDHFVIAGLLLLAGGAATLLRLRGWLWPYGFATIGSWAGFLILGVFEWSQEGSAPGFSLILGSLALLTIVLEAANFLSPPEKSHADPENYSKWWKWLALLNTSLAIAASWFSVRLAFPSGTEDRQLDLFYLAFAGLLAAFTALRFWKKHPVGLTETYFLKASGLVALFVVAWFDGPTRWLSLAAQSVILLWAWNRSRLRWIEVGFGVLVFASLAVMAHDLNRFDATDRDWAFFTVYHIVGLASLTILTAALALHARWSRESDATPRSDTETIIVNPAELLRFLAGIACGGLLVILTIATFDGDLGPGPVMWLSLAALILAAPALVWRRFPPVIAGLTALIVAFGIYLNPEYPERFQLPAIGIGLWLTALGYGLAEVVLQFWRQGWKLGHGVRLVLHGFGVTVLGATLWRSLEGENYSIIPHLLMIVVYATAVAAALIRQGNRFPENHASEDKETPRATQWLLAALIGLVVPFFGVWMTSDFPHQGSWLALAAGVLFASSFFTRSATSALAGAPTLLLSLALYLLRFDESESFSQHLLALLPVVGISGATAFLLLRNSNPESPQGKHLWFDAALHALSLLAIHWLLRSCFELEITFLGDALLALGVVALLRLLPFPALGAISAFPLALGLLHLGIMAIGGEVLFAGWQWWIAAVAILAWLWLSHQQFVEGKSQALSDSLRRFHFLTQGLVGALSLAVAGYHALEHPWHLVSMGAFAVAMASLGQWRKLPGLQEWSCLPLLFGMINAARESFSWTKPESDPSLILIAISLLGILAALHGVVLTRELPAKRRSVAWLHGIGTLFVVFSAFTVSRLGVDELTTVCWGVAALTLFGIGLGFGLRPYRLAGLIGLGLAVIRMWIVDIDDSLYRIYAFFAIAGVLLGVGYLYHRFRHIIERADGEKAPMPKQAED